MQTEKKAADFGLYPEFFGIPDRLVALADYMRYMQLESIRWAMETGERIRSRGLYAMVSDELNIDPDVLHDWVSCGEAIKWDRELQAMTPEERDEYLANLEGEPSDEDAALYREYAARMAEDDPDLADTIMQSVAEARQANYEIDMLNQLLDES